MNRIDQELDREIKRQFGKRANRWSVKKRDFDARTKKVWQKRIGWYQENEKKG
jgi:hypothetical protein